jgi:hypothetical protein
MRRDNLLDFRKEVPEEEQMKKVANMAQGRDGSREAIFRFRLFFRVGVAEAIYTRHYIYYLIYWINQDQRCCR